MERGSSHEGVAAGSGGLVTCVLSSFVCFLCSIWAALLFSSAFLAFMLSHFLALSSAWRFRSFALRFLSSTFFSHSSALRFSSSCCCFFFSSRFRLRCSFASAACFIFLSFSSVRAKHSLPVSTRAFVPLDDLGVVVEGGIGFRNSDNGEGEPDEVEVLRLGVDCSTDAPELWEVSGTGELEPDKDANLRFKVKQMY